MKTVNTLEKLDGEIEANESYFGGKRKGKRVRVFSGKIILVFCLLKRNFKVYTVIILNVQIKRLILIIKEKVKPDGIVYTDTFKSYNALDVNGFKHYRINHSKSFGKDIIT